MFLVSHETVSERRNPRHPSIHRTNINSQGDMAPEQSVTDEWPAPGRPNGDEYSKPLPNDQLDVNNIGKPSPRPSRFSKRDDESNDTIFSSPLAPITMLPTTFAPSLQPFPRQATLEIPSQDAASGEHDPPPSPTNNNNSTTQWGLLAAACILAVTAMATVIVARRILGRQWSVDGTIWNPLYPVIGKKRTMKKNRGVYIFQSQRR
jgi:hypothetical protein